MKMLALALLIAALAAPSTARDRNEIPAATPDGEARSCISRVQIRESRVRSDSVIDFVINQRRAYRVTLDTPCPGLRFEDAFSYRTSLDQLCSNDIITVLYTNGGGLQPGASCGLAPFQPVRLVDPRR